MRPALDGLNDHAKHNSDDSDNDRGDGRFPGHDEHGSEAEGHYDAHGSKPFMVRCSVRMALPWAVERAYRLHGSLCCV
jgi:hypothetical protein